MHGRYAESGDDALNWSLPGVRGAGSDPPAGEDEDCGRSLTKKLFPLRRSRESGTCLNG
jgi:hypothetical protein